MDSCRVWFYVMTWIHVTVSAARLRHKPIPDDAENMETSPEKRLTRHLVRSYKRLGIEGRPVYNASRSMQVKFGLNIMQMDLDEQENMLSTSVWCRIKWKDEFLQWDPEDFSGISTARLSSKKIWIPDIMLYNTADTQMMERDVLVVVKYDGSMLWIPHRIYRSSCKVDVTHFPFDQQVCHMTFGSWAYHGNEINLQFHNEFDTMDLSDLERENTEWVVLDKQKERLSQTYDCCEEPYVTLTFTLRMKRKLVFSSFILTLPCIFLAFMTLVVFWLPPERPDRTSLAMNLFSCFLLLLLILVEAAPPTASSVPTLGVYYCFNMVIIMLSIFLSSIVINITRKGEVNEAVPRWLYKLSVEGLGRLFCKELVNARERVQRKHSQHDTKTVYANNIAQQTTTMCQTQRETEVNNIQGHLNNHVRYQGDIRRNCSRDNGSVTEESMTSLLNAFHTSNNHTLEHKAIKLIRGHLLSLEKSLRKVDRNTKEILNSMRDKQHVSQVRIRRLEWQIVGATVDRTCFVIFLFAIVSSLLTLFPRPFQLQNI